MRGWVRDFDWLLLGCVTILASMGLVTLASIDTIFFFRQVLWFVLAFFVIIGCSRIRWQWLFTQSWFRYGFYWVSVGLLLVPYALGHTIRGTKSWIILGPLQFEPSELAKVALIVVLAGFFSRRYVAAWQSKNIALSFVYMLIPAGLTAMQPDLGSALVLGGIWLGFLLMNGIHKRRFLIGLALAIVLLFVLWMGALRPYQKDRITGFIFPDIDPLGVNYNLIQSKIAIGSAGFFGKGFGGGTQTQLGFLPEAHTDFLFASFIEEWGLLGGTVLVLTYVVLLFRIATTGLRLHRNDEKFVVLGIGLFFLIHFFVNIGSNIGIVPIVGIGLPFVSYGGSNLLTAALLIGIIERIKLVSQT